MLHPNINSHLVLLPLLSWRAHHRQGRSTQHNVVTPKTPDLVCGPMQVNVHMQGTCHHTTTADWNQDKGSCHCHMSTAVWHIQSQTGARGRPCMTQIQLSLTVWVSESAWCDKLEAMCENETNAQVITRKQLAVVIFYHSMHNTDLGWPLTTLFVAVLLW